MLLSLLTENRTLVLNLMIAFSVLIFQAAGGFDLVKRRTVCYPSNTMPLTVSHLGVALLECDHPLRVIKKLFDAWRYLLVGSRQIDTAYRKVLFLLIEISQDSPEEKRAHDFFC